MVQTFEVDVWEGHTFSLEFFGDNKAVVDSLAARARTPSTVAKIQDNSFLRLAAMVRQQHNIGIQHLLRNSNQIADALASLDSPLEILCSELFPLVASRIRQPPRGPVRMRTFSDASIRGEVAFLGCWVAVQLGGKYERCPAKTFEAELLGAKGASTE